MAKMNKEELERVIARDLPGYKVSRQSKVERAAEAAETSEGSRDLAAAVGGGSDRRSELRRKYLGLSADEGEAAAVGSNPGQDDDSDDDEEIVAVEPEAANHPWDRGARPKAVVIKNKKVIGMQG
jgi:hypothetical protein